MPLSWSVMDETLTRVSIVTGAASGIGRATALALAGPNIGLVLHTGTNEAGLAAVADAARARGATVATLRGPVGVRATADALVETAAGRFRRLDAVVAAAGRADRGGAVDLDVARLAGAMAVSAQGFLDLVQASLGLLARSDSPRIVAVSSYVAHVYRSDLGLFAASAAGRAALEALVRSLSRELAPSGIAVNAVAPGLTKKDPGKASALSAAQIAGLEAAIPMGRRADPAEIAAAIAFLASPAASYITGQIVRVDGGLS
jgi:NAD(P)-dependent dehydrogenase (short-subunit alcohol dehydrogenase family)